MIAIKGKRYLHKNGGEYEVVGFAQHTENPDELVIYQGVLSKKMFARPKYLFEDGRFTIIEGEYDLEPDWKKRS